MRYLGAMHLALNKYTAPLTCVLIAAFAAFTLSWCDHAQRDDGRCGTASGVETISSLNQASGSSATVDDSSEHCVCVCHVSLWHFTESPSASLEIFQPAFVADPAPPACPSGSDIFRPPITA
jgi:hypothetical protein